jgi:tRNA threonylcarbamoyladenosine biosynthesis protein TsaE
MSGLSMSAVVDEPGLEAIARRVASALEPGQAVLLRGELGSGKSVFVRAMLRALGVEGHIPSPSYIIDAVYDCGGVVFHHIDLYRLSGDPLELEQLGIADALGSGAMAAVEWAGRLPGGIGLDAVHIDISFTGDPGTREVRIDDRRLAGHRDNGTG